MNDRVQWLLRTAADVPKDDAWLSEAERHMQRRLHLPARRDDWRLGRWTAKQALSRVQRLRPLDRLSVLAADDGAPEACFEGTPLSLQLSLSHREGVAVAGVFDGPVGIDLERITPREASFVRTFFTEAEARAVAAHPEPELAQTLTWSAKESVLKLCRTGLRRDTRSVQVQLPDAPIGRRWLALTARDLELQQDLRIWCRRVGPSMLTVVGGAGAEPRAIDHATACA